MPIEKQQEALNFIEFLAFKMGDRQVKKVDEILLVDQEPFVSCYDLTKNGLGLLIICLTICL
ncbi:hypothetical protein [Pseudanabaena sp. ABRG5-3]|uniref:hypothetical protein n=1 Tax=Pseudanabaena sp. ABRG5-3 TaxID=685565 RepID=UPI000DC73E86|nr:hypothetical protein [Pseudanabaena sp. ABRG5-3]BBC26946.1 hypothetical protein ABRG53_c107 [Pseudanabaena sp. ABRG5-3]